MIIDNSLLFYEDATEAADEAPTVEVEKDMVDGSCMNLFCSCKVGDDADTGTLDFSVTDENGAEVYTFSGTVNRDCVIGVPLPAGWAGELTFTLGTIENLTISAGVAMGVTHIDNWQGETPYTANS